MCGWKLTGCVFVVSFWGIIFLVSLSSECRVQAILGALYYNESVGLFEDLPGLSTVSVPCPWKAQHDKEAPWETRVKKYKDNYKQNAYNAWAAAGIFGGFLVASVLRAMCLRRR